jgi:hypothetical protein
LPVGWVKESQILERPSQKKALKSRHILTDIGMLDKIKKNLIMKGALTFGYFLVCNYK